MSNFMKKIILFFFVLVLVAAGAFYGGMKYGQSTRQNFARQNFDGQNLSPEQRQQFSQGRTGRVGAGFLSGEIIAKDEQSLTVKMPDGGSKIVFYSDSTEINKTVKGTSGDLEIGKSVAINGKTNQDGSITAQSIQLRPAVFNP